ncbi:MAG TPA: DegT/DnrJ/EryC1/StrS family aminotransferase, partial [Chitinophagaceae bacterium]|nr:DegT/DnrJ/EryC1/StrS family aminotransferase [Chitinophagaceae bacterium]
PKASNGVTREDIRLALNQENIESRPLWKPMHLQPFYKDALYFGGDVAAQLFENGLCLPSDTKMSSSDLQRVVTVIKELFK